MLRKQVSEINFYVITFCYFWIFLMHLFKFGIEEESCSLSLSVFLLLLEVFLLSQDLGFGTCVATRSYFHPVMNRKPYGDRISCKSNNYISGIRKLSVMEFLQFHRFTQRLEKIYIQRETEIFQVKICCYDFFVSEYRNYYHSFIPVTMFLIVLITYI